MRKHAPYRNYAFPSLTYTCMFIKKRKRKWIDWNGVVRKRHSNDGRSSSRVWIRPPAIQNTAAPGITIPSASAVADAGCFALHPSPTHSMINCIFCSRCLSRSSRSSSSYPDAKTLIRAKNKWNFSTVALSLSVASTILTRRTKLHRIWYDQSATVR